MEPEPKNLRLEKLKALVEANGGHRELCRRFPELNPDFIGQLLKGTRNFGERAARNMALQIGEPPNYFEEPPDTERLRELAELMEPLTRDQRAQVIGFARGLVLMSSNQTSVDAEAKAGGQAAHEPTRPAIPALPVESIKRKKVIKERTSEIKAETGELLGKIHASRRPRRNKLEARPEDTQPGASQKKNK